MPIVVNVYFSELSGHVHPSLPTSFTSNVCTSWKSCHQKMILLIFVISCVCFSPLLPVHSVSLSVCSTSGCWPYGQSHHLDSLAFWLLVGFANGKNQQGVKGQEKREVMVCLPHSLLYLLGFFYGYGFWQVPLFLAAALTASGSTSSPFRSKGSDGFLL